MALFKGKDPPGDTEPHEREDTTLKMELTSENLKNALGKSSDFKTRTIWINAQKRLSFMFCYIDGMVDTAFVSKAVLKPMLQQKEISAALTESEIINVMAEGGVYALNVMRRSTMDEAVSDILTGSAAMIFDGQKTALTFECKGFMRRQTAEPTSENVKKGGKDAFVESLRGNTGLVRNRLHTPFLRIEDSLVGRRSLTPVSVVHIEGLTNPELVGEVKKRLDSIDIDGLLSAGSLEEYFVDNKKSMFPQMSYTERADKFCGEVLRGRVGLIIDGLPMAYILPGTFSDLMRTPEDFSAHYIVASCVSLLRYVSMGFALLLPAFYTAVASFHQELIPAELLNSMINNKQEVPFSTFAEVLIMLAVFEMLLEAGFRMPPSIGQAVSILGALVIGQAAVEARFVSPAVVIIIALCGIAGFTCPNQDLSSAVRVWRLAFVVFACFGGLFGLVIGFILMIWKLCRLESLGVPYLLPITSNAYRGLFRSTLLRDALPKLKYRPDSLHPLDRRNQR